MPRKYALPIPVSEQGWPHRAEHVSVTAVAKIFGVDRRTLSRAMETLRDSDGESAGTTIPEIETAARIFVEFGEGGGPSVEAGRLIDNLGVPASRVAQTAANRVAAPREIRHRVLKKEIEALYRKSPSAVLEAYKDAADECAEKDTANRQVRVAKIIKVLIKQRIADLPSRTIPGLPNWRNRIAGENFEDFLARVEQDFPDHFRSFATLADWMAFSGPADIRLFAYVEGKGRPLDFPLLGRRQWSRAKFVLMNAKGYARESEKGISEDWAAMEGNVIAKVAGQPKKASKGSLRT